ncbi:hypothetical protein [Planctobacterium marinum]|uniref:hypothetical protein n=1 Tax=Planctobacterium marinum TaxID=1631968 RepID=UPI001E63CEED|nr:hypothetical protein [Planctobacterium marinum]MCC2604268.1 hypothetical protein [Planctobacterium marinum]
MDNLSRFYIDLATDTSKADSFFHASEAEKMQILESAGIADSSKLVAADQSEIRHLMMNALSNSTGSWNGLDNNAGNDDNKNNIGRLGRTKQH